jgi:hypothetical protein
LALAVSKVDEFFDALAGVHQDVLDGWLAFFAGLAAGLRSDGNPIERLPAPFPVARVAEFATLAPIELDIAGLGLELPDPVSGPGVRGGQDGLGEV